MPRDIFWNEQYRRYEADGYYYTPVGGPADPNNVSAATTASVSQVFTVNKAALVERITALRDTEQARIDNLEKARVDIVRDSLTAALAVAEGGEFDEETKKRVSIDRYSGSVSVHPTKEQAEALSKARNVPQVVTVERASADLEFLAMVNEDTVTLDGSTRFNIYLPSH